MLQPSCLLCWRSLACSTCHLLPADRHHATITNASPPSYFLLPSPQPGLKCAPAHRQYPAQHSYRTIPLPTRPTLAPHASSPLAPPPQAFLSDVLRSLHVQLEQLSGAQLSGLMVHVCFLQAAPSEAWLASLSRASLARYGELSTEQLLELANSFIFLQ